MHTHTCALERCAHTGKLSVRKRRDDLHASENNDEEEEEEEGEEKEECSVAGGVGMCRISGVSPPTSIEIAITTD